MEFDVTIDRDKWIGGSDLPAIMGISPFKTRWELLLEKAGLKENDFVGNRFTAYGQTMEPLIRDYVNGWVSKPFEPNRVIVGNFRAHTDGCNGHAVLEIKTTSHIFDTVGEYKGYLVQLLKYMEVNKVSLGVLVVYHRPDNFSTDFDVERLHIYEIHIDDYAELLAEINAELDRFRADLARLRENPLLTEQDFFGNNKLVELSNRVIAFEAQLAAMKSIERQLKDAKTALFDEMTKHDVKSWTTPNGTKITRVDSVPGAIKSVAEFDVAAFKRENPALHEMYLREVPKETAGKRGYVKISLKGATQCTN